MELGQKALLVSMTNSQGWMLATKLGESILTQMDAIALDCDDDSKVAGLVREARAARKFWNAFINNIGQAKNPEVTDDSFIEVSM